MTSNKKKKKNVKSKLSTFTCSFAPLEHLVVTLEQMFYWTKSK